MKTAKKKSLTWRQNAKVFSDLKPTRPAAMTPTVNGKGLLIAGHDQGVVMVVTGKDLKSLRSMIDIVTNTKRTWK